VIDPKTGGSARLGAFSSLDDAVVVVVVMPKEAEEAVDAAVSGVVLLGAPNEKVGAVDASVDAAGAPKVNPPLDFEGSEVEVGAPNENEAIEDVVLGLDSVEAEAGTPKVNEEVPDWAAGAPKVKLDKDSPDLLEAAGAPKENVDEELEVAPPKLNPLDDIAPAMIFGPEDTGAGNELPGLGVSQHAHLSLELSLGTMQVSQVHLADADAGAAAAVDPGLGVSQQTHFDLSASF